VIDLLIFVALIPVAFLIGGIITFLIVIQLYKLFDTHSETAEEKKLRKIGERMYKQ